MMNRFDEKNEKLYIHVETNEEGIADFKRSGKFMPELKDVDVRISKMIVEGKTVPAFQVEVKEPEKYIEYKREQWKAEDEWKRQNRCEICGKNGKSRRCPVRVENPDYTGAPGEKKTISVDCSHCPYGYDKLFRPVKGTMTFSGLDMVDETDNVTVFEAEDSGSFEGERYEKILRGFADYVREKYPKKAECARMIELLGTEMELTVVSEIMQKPYQTLVSWRKWLRPVFEEYAANCID